ncbi:MAG: ABC transporter ATP-binding protein [Microbacteriaceae bacterium]|nr:ABC transporter ATP-binding protein [Microbacteriaceae bacterium]
MITMTGVHYAYPDADHEVLTGVDLSVDAGQVVGIVGASGAGKTTLAKSIAGFIPHSEGGELTGSVVVDGLKVADATLAQVVSRVGLVTQNPFNQISGAKYTVREEIAFGLENLGVPRDEMSERVDAVGTRLGIRELFERSPYALSGGQMQLVAIASMMIMAPRVLVMDEPTSQLDPSGSRLVFDIVNGLADDGTAVVIFEHKLELLREHADVLHVLADGVIARSGSAREVLADPRTDEWGVGSTRFTRAARRAIEQKLLPATTALPVSLEDAKAVFSK